MSVVDAIEATGVHASSRGTCSNNRHWHITLRSDESDEIFTAALLLDTDSLCRYDDSAATVTLRDRRGRQMPFALYRGKNIYGKDQRSAGDLPDWVNDALAAWAAAFE